MMPMSLNQKKYKEIYKAKEIEDLVNVKLKVYVETFEDEKQVYQQFRLVVANFKLLKYFTDNKFIGALMFEEAMEDYFAGNGEDIFFRDKKIYPNRILVIYEKTSKDAKFDQELADTKFEVIAPIPKSEGCLDCTYFRKKHRTCIYYQKMGMNLKKKCGDFRQKEVDMSDSNIDNNTLARLSEIAKELGTTVPQLLSEYSDPYLIVEKYENGELKMLNE